MTVNRKIIYLPFKKDKKVDLGNYSPGENYGGYSQKTCFQTHQRQEHDQEQSACIYPLANHAWPT